MCISSYIELQSPNVYFYVHGDLVQPKQLIWSIIDVSYVLQPLYPIHFRYLSYDSRANLFIFISTLIGTSSAISKVGVAA